MISPKVSERIHAHLAFLYGKQDGNSCYQELLPILTDFRQRNPEKVALNWSFDESDSILITYADQIQSANRLPLSILVDFLGERIQHTIKGIHLLPFFPYSSDDGFSIVDYQRVDPALGSWRDIFRLGENFTLMFDAVINHVSVQSNWFKGYLQDDPRYADYFIEVDPNLDLSTVFRPRTCPLLTPFETSSGIKWVWTTFSADQVDLNYQNPSVLLEIIQILLGYVERGAIVIRLDAIAFLWKRIGTTCMHLEETHRVIQLVRAILDAVAPAVKLVTETNVPHEDNITYFGDGSNEAQMIYQFPLAPLLMNAIQTGKSETLSRWAEGLHLLSDRVTFINFTASHDGVGVMPVRGILNGEKIRALEEQTLAHGGFVSYKTNQDGSQSAYELNISYFDALSDPNSSEALEIQIDRFMVTQAIMLSLIGIPGIYVHSLFGSRSWSEGVEITGQKRSINREKLVREVLEQELATPGKLRRQVFSRYVHLLRQRATRRAFHPHGGQKVILDNPALFVLLRIAPEGDDRVLCIHNVSNGKEVYNWNEWGSEYAVDLISGTRLSRDAQPILVLAPYQSLWLVPSDARA